EVAPLGAATEMEAGVETGRDVEIAVAAQRLERVLHEVQEHLRQLRPVAADGREARVERGLERHASPARSLLLQRQHVVQDAMDVERTELQPRGRAELAKLLDETVQPL